MGLLYLRGLCKCLLKYCSASGSSKGLLLRSKLLVAVLVDMMNVSTHCVLLMVVILLCTGLCSSGM
jgi:hypothetical protein